jgi:hypothetical protein
MRVGVPMKKLVRFLFVFLNGPFNVGSEKAGREGGFSGKMCNLMKKGSNGKLLMYRQLANNN